MNTPEMKIPAQTSSSDMLLIEPKGITWKTLDCSNCKARVITMTDMMASRSTMGRP